MCLPYSILEAILVIIVVVPVLALVISMSGIMVCMFIDSIRRLRRDK